MGLKGDIKELKKRCENDYQEYNENLKGVIKEYADKCGEFNMLIGTINGERLSFRKEIRVLYDFLKAIGGNLNDEKQISVFDFVDEAPAPNQIYSEISALSEPNFADNDFWDWMRDFFGGCRDYFKNREEYEKFLKAVENKKMEYNSDIFKRTTQISHLEDALEIAKIYREIIVTVRDTVFNKILPELELIQAFLYADAIREKILDGEEPTDIVICSISEYKNTKQDIHYQFVKNTFDFYRISTAFFKQTVLTDILQDRIVSEEEKKEFENQMDAIKQQIAAIESKKVVGNE